jgi:hypothetical protein
MAKYLKNEVLNFLNNKEISIENHQGQSYDNAQNMTGKYLGLEARILEVW